MKQIRNFLLSAVLVFAVTALGQDAGNTATARAPGTVFRDCPDCPEMVVIRAGDFMMGSSEAEKIWAATHGGNAESVADESPRHKVSLRSFALGKYDVTRAQYAIFVHETGHPLGDGCHESSMPKSNKKADESWQNPGYSQTDRDPVTCVSWEDAQAYITWLNDKLHKASSTSTEGAYRLPSESEWEYAARAGKTTRFWWGDDDSRAANNAWYKGNAGGKTHRVGSKPANPFGIYEMVGNVWEWTEDCYTESYANASTDGNANEAAKDCLRVDRGGSWMYPAWLLRSATRERNPADYRDAIMGFRLAKTLQGKESPTLTSTTQAQKSEPPPGACVVELKASDGTILKASYFAAAKSGPGVLLLHQSNRTRDSWDGVARQLAAAGMNTLTLDMRGFGESGGTPNTKLTDEERAKVRAMRPGDVETALHYLVAQPGVKREIIGVGGAGEFGVGRSVEYLKW